MPWLSELFPTGDARRFWTALAVSCLLHGTAIFLPLPERAQTGKPGRPPAESRYTVSLVVAKSMAILAMPVPESRETAPTTAGDSAAIHRAPGAEESGDLLPHPELGYFAIEELSKRPQPTVLPELDGEETKPIVASGRLVLRLWIDDRGEVAAVAVAHSDLPDIFARAASAAFKRSRFTPGERNGLRVGTVMKIEVRYDDNRTPAP